MKRNFFAKIQDKINIIAPACKWYYDRLWISRIVAVISLANLGLVAFDTSYIYLRDFWLHGKVTLGSFKFGPYEYEGIDVPVLTPSISNTIIKYDIFKGIEPYRDTEEYLERVEQLIANLNESGLDNSQTQKILADLRVQSIEMIDEDPFQLANKSGNLEKIKNEMKEHMESYIDNPEDSSRVAFRSFWTTEHLENRISEELEFFNQEIKPLIETNYYRPLGENGEFVDNFGLLDFPFVVVFLADFIIRCLAISFRYHGVRFQDAILWRWYDLIFFLPTWRWLRVIPVSIRLDEAKLLDSSAVKQQASQGFVASIAGDVTEVVILRIINQVQKAIAAGEIEKVLSAQKTGAEYIDLNDTNEVAEISKLLINAVAYKVLPEIRPEVENFLGYTFEKTIVESPVYRNVENFPGLRKLPHDLSQNLAHQSYQIFLDTLNNLLQEDPVFDRYLEQIIEKFSQSFISQTSTKDDLDRIENLLIALLDEIKVNYVQQLSQGDIEALLDEKRAIKQKQ